MTEEPIAGQRVLITATVKGRARPVNHNQWWVQIDGQQGYTAVHQDAIRAYGDGADEQGERSRAEVAEDRAAAGDFDNF